jgi:beta-fructofuranosidase
VYASPGFGLSEIGDVEIFPHGDEIHLFHLTLPNHDVVQHLVSTDGLAWHPLPPALRTGDPGACDDDQIWTMSVTERNGRYSMLYTALATAERGRVQRTALAVSDDLIHWTKSDRNPVGEADPRWYEADRRATGSVSWRDPKPVLAGDTYYAAVCARENDGPLMRRGCVGLLTSTDLEHWEPRPPLFAPRRYWDLECPQVFRIADRWYLTAAIMEDRTQRYWVASGIDGPYETPPDGGVLAPLGHYAGRICRWRDLDLYCCWHEPRAVSRNAGIYPGVDWTTVTNPFGKYIPAPLVLVPRPDGSLARKSFPGWSAYLESEPMPAHPSPRSLYHGQPNDASDWTIDAGHGRFDVLATGEPATNVWFEGALTLRATSGGLGFRLDDDGSGYFITIQPGSRDVLLHKWLPGRDPFDIRPWFRYAEIQRGQLPRLVPADSPLTFRLLTVGPYVELTLNEEVVLAALTAERTGGRLGIWAESGTAQATGVRAAPMRSPELR